MTYGRMVHFCLEAADKLAEEGISTEIIDLRTIVPLDIDTVLESAKKTHRVLIVHEAVQFLGVGAEVCSQIIDSDAFYYLDAPIRRIGGKSTPIPFNPKLEAETFPTVEKIYNGVKSLF